MICGKYLNMMKSHERTVLGGNMSTLDDAVPCSVCGAKPILSGGWRSGRLKCPNYKSKEILHGNLNCSRNGLVMGFTNWCNYFWNEEQIKNEGIPTIVEEWNYIQKNHVTNSGFGKMGYGI